MAGPETDSAKPKPEAAKTSAAGGGDATRDVGTPAVGTSKAAAAAGLATVGPEASQVNQRRRRLVWVAVTGFLGAWFIAFLRFFLPRTLFEPPTIFKIGYPSDYSLGVDTKWQQRYRIWVDRTPDRVFVIYARCTHLGCTPDWKAGENKFKWPCTGSRRAGNAPPQERLAGTPRVSNNAQGDKGAISTTPDRSCRYSRASCREGFA